MLKLLISFVRSYENNVSNFVLGAGNLCGNVFAACPHFCVNVRAQLFIRFPHFFIYFFCSDLGRIPYLHVVTLQLEF
jgi:hypothetical protein